MLYYIGLVLCYAYVGGLVFTAVVSSMARIRWWRSLLIGVLWPIIAAGDLNTLMREWIRDR